MLRTRSWVADGSRPAAASRRAQRLARRPGRGPAGLPARSARSCRRRARPRRRRPPGTPRPCSCPPGTRIARHAAVGGLVYGQHAGAGVDLTIPGRHGPNIESAIVILLLSTSDTDLLSARASGAGYRLGNPARLAVDDLRPCSTGVDLVVVRLLGGRRAWEDGLDALLAGPAPGRRARWGAGARRRADGAVHRAGWRGRRGARLPRARRPRQPARAGQLPVRHRAAHRQRVRAARADPGVGPAGAHRRGAPRARSSRVLYYRAHHMAGNTAFVEALCDGDRGRGRAGAAGVLRVAAHRARRADRAAGHGGRARGHRARGRRHHAGRRGRRAATTRGTSARSPRSTCRSSRACA